MTNPLFSPFSVGSLSTKNRVAMAPMTREFSPNSVPGADVAEYYKKRAEGDVGLIITEGTCVGHVAATMAPNVPFFDGDDALAGWQQVAQAVHQAGGKIAPQLWHVGAIRRPGIEPGGDAPGYSPSGMAMPGKVTGHAMSKSDIDDVIAAYANAAKNAELLGFDALEIHGAHGYLIDQFFWPGTNQRDDEYGGSLENRTRFAVEIVQAIRAEVSRDFPIILRYSQWKQQDYKAKLAETPQQLDAFLAPLTDAGVDVYHCSTRRFWQAEFDDSDLNLAGWTKKITGQPTISVGSVGLNSDFLAGLGRDDAAPAQITSLDSLLERMDKDEFDLIAVGRALIANPDWVKKVQSGKIDDLLPYDEVMRQSLV